MRFLKGFALAFNMLTIIPFFKVHHFFSGINGYSAMFYPVVGFLLGSILFGIHFILEPYIASTHLCVIIFALWVVLTGALHLDGFSDTVDGLFVDAKKSLEVMKDSHVGGMGMIFSVVFLILKLSSVIHFDLFYLLPVVLMLSRLNAVMAIYFYDYISGGVGRLIKDELNMRHLLFAIFFSFVVASIFSSIILFFINILVLMVVARFFTKRIGGLNGDIYGFLIEVSEVVLLNVLIIKQIV